MSIDHNKIIMKFVQIFLFLILYGLNVNAQESRPNILFIYTDDQAEWTTGASGNEQAHTPNIDQLADEGAYLKNAYVTTPVCSPARASLMTSQYASELDIHDFIVPPGHVLYESSDQTVGLDPETVTFAEVLSEAGYKTGLVGKWHLGDWTKDPSNKYHPTNHGYDYFMGLTGGGTSPVDPPLEKDGEVKEFEGLTTDILTDHAIEFLKRNGDESFLLSVHYRAPHGAWLPVAQEDWAPYKNKDLKLPNPDYPNLDKKRAKRMMREYLASVSGVDRNVGRLLHTLDMLHISDNTIVIFTSDHGYNMGHNGIWHKGNGIWLTNENPPATKNIASRYRPNMYDQSLKVPAIVRWPGVVKPGTKISDIVSNLDWFPTLLEMVRTEIPENKIVRGRSIVPMLKGNRSENPKNDFYSEYTMINYSLAYMRSYQTLDWKLVIDFKNPQRNELYNISVDPQENINLIYDSRPKIQKKIESLERQIEIKMDIIGDNLLDSLSIE